MMDSILNCRTEREDKNEMQMEHQFTKDPLTADDESVEFKVLDDDGNSVYPPDCPEDITLFTSEEFKQWQERMDAYMVFYHRAWEALPAAELSQDPTTLPSCGAEVFAGLAALSGLSLTGQHSDATGDTTESYAHNMDGN